MGEKKRKRKKRKEMKKILQACTVGSLCGRKSETYCNYLTRQYSNSTTLRNTGNKRHNEGIHGEHRCVLFVLFA